MLKVNCFDMNTNTVNGEKQNAAMHIKFKSQGKCSVYAYRLTLNLNFNFLGCCSLEIYDSTVCTAVKRSRAMTLILVGQCQMSNSSELFSYTK